MSIPEEAREGADLMRYVLALLLPPIAVLSCGKVFQALLNVLLLPFVWIPAIVHACFVVHNHHADQRADRVIRAMRGSARLA